VEQLELPNTAGRNEEGYNFGKQFGNFFQSSANTQLSNPTSSMYRKEKHTHTKT
jgi:hypothetical protein